MTPNGRRLSDIAMIALAGTGLGVLAIQPDDLVTELICSPSSVCSEHTGWLVQNSQRLAVAILTSITLYAVLVRGPTHYKQWRLRNRLATQYRHFKETCIAEFLLIADGSFELDFAGSLLEPNNFRNYFEKEGSSGRKRWHVLQHNLDQRRLEQILSSMTILHDEITLALNNIDVRCYAPFEFRKRLAVTMDAMNSESQFSERAEGLANFLWSVFAARDAVYDIGQEDLFKKTLNAIDCDPALPFTRPWWRRAERREPLSAYETLL